MLVVDGCPSGWCRFKSSCYYVSGDKVDQATALARCRSNNADLVSISDGTENEFVHKIWLVIVY